MIFFLVHKILPIVFPIISLFAGSISLSSSENKAANTSSTAILTSPSKRSLGVIANAQKTLARCDSWVRVPPTPFLFPKRVSTICRTNNLTAATSLLLLNSWAAKNSPKKINC